MPPTITVASINGSDWPQVKWALLRLPAHVALGQEHHLIGDTFEQYRERSTRGGWQCLGGAALSIDAGGVSAGACILASQGRIRTFVS